MTRAFAATNLACIFWAAVAAFWCLPGVVALEGPARAVAAAAAAAAAAEESTEISSSPGRFVLPLHRQRVPVQSDTDSVSYKSVYFGSISIGGPERQTFSVVFDTGSGHVILPSDVCESHTCQIHSRYSRQKSGEAVDVDYDGTPVASGAPRDQITVAFGTGEVTGQFVEDSLCLGLGHDADMNSCITVRMVMATEMTHEPFHAFSFDGVLGLGLDSLTLAPEFSFFGVMTQQKTLDQPSFGVFLAENDDEVSEISFGGHTPDLVQSDLSWTRVANPELGYWQVQITKLRIGDRELDFCNDGQCRAVVDTGTSLLAVPKGLIGELQQELTDFIRDPVPEADGELDCRKAKGAYLYFELGDAIMTLTPGDYTRQSIQLMGDDRDIDATDESSEGALPDGNTSLSEALERSHMSVGPDWETGPRTCKPTLMPIELPEPIGPKLFIWGEPVLRKYYTVYNWKDKKVGFGLARHTSPKVTLPSESSSASLPPLGPLLL